MMGATFTDYEPKAGRWSFKVDLFSSTDGHSILYMFHVSWSFSSTKSVIGCACITSKRSVDIDISTLYNLKKIC